MDGTDSSQNSDERSGRLSQCGHGHYTAFIRSVAPALLILFCSFIRHTYITWQEDPCTTATITVHGIKTEPSLTLVCNGKRYTVEGKESALPDRRKIYHFHLTNLEPDTHYTFQVENSYHSFKTLSVKPPYCFVEGGDWENTKEAAELAKLAASKKPDAVLLGGDYPSDVMGRKDAAKWDHWLDVYTQNFEMTPFVMAVGNHEVVGGYGQPKSQAPFFFDYFRTEQNQESYYTLPLGQDYQLYILDSGHVASHEEQKEWLASQLRNERFKIALYHVPLYPSVRFAEKNTSYALTVKGMQLLQKQGKVYSPGSAAGREHWQPLFKKHRVRLAFEHHDQTLKRTREIAGTTYLGDGGWGPLRQYPPIQGYFHNYFAKICGKQHFFWLLTIDDGVHAEAISIEDQRLDSVHIWNK